jgi:uncharacterized protein
LRWTDQKKKRIIDSRVKSIDVLSAAINKTGKKDIILLQSAAIGIYGSRGDEVLTEESSLGSQDTFRINCLKTIEERTREQHSDAVLLRIGNVLGSEGALLGFMKLFSMLRGKKYGAGGQYMPWIHVEDIGSAMLHIVSRFPAFKGKAVNLTSP